jgi:hypothetical protein
VSDIKSNRVRVITICSLKHSEVWKLTSELLPKFLIADKFVVYVPNNEIEEFKLITNGKIEILSQDTLGQEYFTKLREAVSIAGNQARFGWYLQQFYKIEALLRSAEELVVIWDADCVPVKPIPLFAENNTPIYMRAADEINGPYFETIERLLGLSRIQDLSFVIPGFPILKPWVIEMIEHIEATNPGLKWFDALIKYSALNLPSGFSETETLGTWVANKYPNEWSTIPGSWERHGQRRFGYARDLNTERLTHIGLKKNLDIISFENWDLRGFKLIKRRIKKFLTILGR